MNKPVAWINTDFDSVSTTPNIRSWFSYKKEGTASQPLYTHPHPDNLGLALSIIDQQKLEIENLRKADLTQKNLCKAELTKKDVEAARKEGYEFGYAQGCMHEKYGINGTNPVKELAKAEGFALTDEEILEELLIPKSEWDSYKAHHCLKQIRAILRKAGA